MGTSYPLLQKQRLEIRLDEHSSRFDFVVTFSYGDNFCEVAARNVDHEDLIAMAGEIIKAVGYNCRDKEREKFTQKIEQALLELRK